VLMMYAFFCLPTQHWRLDFTTKLPPKACVQIFLQAPIAIVRAIRVLRQGVERGLEEEAARGEEGAAAELAESVLPAPDFDAAADTELLPDAAPDPELLTDAARELETERDTEIELDGAPEVAAREAEIEPEVEMEMEFDVDALHRYTTIRLLPASPTKVRDP